MYDDNVASDVLNSVPSPGFAGQTIALYPGICWVIYQSMEVCLGVWWTVHWSQWVYPGICWITYHESLPQDNYVRQYTTPVYPRIYWTMYHDNIIYPGDIMDNVPWQCTPGIIWTMHHGNVPRGYYGQCTTAVPRKNVEQSTATILPWICWTMYHDIVPCAIRQCTITIYPGICWTMCNDNNLLQNCSHYYDALIQF